MSAQPATFKPFTPEERASFLAYRFGSTLDWSSRILVEINYPTEELRWFVDAVQGICKGKECRIAHSTLATRAVRFKNPAQAKSLAKRAIETNNEWSRLNRCMIFDIEAPKPGEREGKDKRARTRYTDYLTAAAVRAQESEHKVKKSDELRWKKDSKFRFETRQKILAKAVALLPHFDSVEEMPGPPPPPKESQPMALSEYAEQRRNIMLAENRRVLDRVCDGELVEVDDIEARRATLEVHYSKTLLELKDSFEATRSYLIKQCSTRLRRAANAVEPIEAVASVDEILAQKSAADVPLTKCKSDKNLGGDYDVVWGVAHDPLSDDPAAGHADWLNEIVTPGESAPLSAPPPHGNTSTKGVAHDPLSPPPAEDALAEFEEVIIGDVAAPAAVFSLTQRDCALSYAALGQPVFPTKTNKSPYTARGFKEATTDEATIRGWWQKHPDAGIGIPTGRASGLLVLDRDDRHGGDASLSALVAQHGDLPPTQQATTPSGGAHYVFKYPAGMHIGNTAGKLGKGLDTRGEGGYIVAPGCDPARRWENALDPADAPEWMIEALLSEKHAPVNTDRTVFHYPFSGGRFFDEGERNTGLRNVAYGRWIHGWAENENDLIAQVLQVNANRCVPPLPEDEATRLAESAAQKFPRGERKQEVTA